MYINFFPGNIREERSLTIDQLYGYAVQDLEGLVRSVIEGCTCSCYIAPEGEDGDIHDMIAALEDGEVLARWFGESDDEEAEEDRAQREAVEEVYGLLVDFVRSR